MRLKAGSEHARQCFFTPAGAIRQLVADARAIDDLCDLFDESEGKVVFRLGAVSKAISAAQQTQLSEADVTQPNAAATSYKRHKRIANYLRSATGVARLHALVKGESRRILAEQLEIWTKEGPISWRAFFFTHDRLPQLYELLSERGKPFEHPIAIEFIHRKWIDDGDQLKSLRGVGGRDQEPFPVVPWLTLHGQWQESAFSVSKTYIALIHPRARKNREWRNIYGDLHHRSQIAPVNDSGVEIDAEP